MAPESGAGATATATVHVALEEVFVRDAAGRLFSPSGFGDAFWARYKAVFDHVVIVARVRAGEDDGRMSPISLNGVGIEPVPLYRGAVDYLRQRSAVRRALVAAARAPGAFVVRLPGAIGGLIAAERARRGRPFAVELVGDPADVFSSGGVGGALAPLFRSLFVPATQRACRAAVATAYVTRSTLQKRYPPAPGRFTTHFSSVELPASAWRDPAGIEIRETGPFTLFAAGSMEQMYKGFDVLIEALASLRRGGPAIRLRLAGEGRFRDQLESLARERGLSDEVAFLGQTSRDQVLEEMRRCDLFVMPSRTEGLPRAMIEAMAQGAPAIGSRVGGIPELLAADDLAPQGDVAALAGLISDVLGNAARRRAMSERNLMVSRDFAADVLEARRRAFYLAVREGSVEGGAR
jgi:glycosyltransferase involved in cell wall biosynthesis